MSTLDGIRLFPPGGPPTSGGAFLLTGPARISRAIDCPGGWTAEVARGGRYVVARHPSDAGGYAASRDGAFTAAQQCLDLLCIARDADLGIRDASTEHIAWWPEAGGQVLRTAHTLTLGLSFGATVTVLRDGKPVPPPPRPATDLHDSIRYFRLAQITDDLFDAYRNLYLALESILDRIAPQAVNGSGHPEKEGVWLRRALGVAGTRVNLAHHAPRGSVDPVGDLFSELYRGTRTALFHAKTSRPSFLPHAPGGQNAAVAAAVRRLACLYMALAREELHARPDTDGVLTHAGFDHLLGPLCDSLLVHATNGTVASGPDGDSLAVGGTLAALETRQAPELGGPSLRAVLGAAGRERLGGLEKLAAIVLAREGSPVSSGTVDGVLTLDGVERLECLVWVRNRNPRHAREHFAS